VTTNVFQVRQLLEGGADPNLASELLRTPLMEAARKGFAEVVALLLEHGADALARNKSGRTALAQAKHAEVIKLLKDAQQVQLDKHNRVARAGVTPRNNTKTNKKPAAAPKPKTKMRVVFTTEERRVETNIPLSATLEQLEARAKKKMKTKSVKLRVGKKWLDADGTTLVSELGVEEGTVIEVSTDYEEEL